MLLPSYAVKQKLNITSILQNYHIQCDLIQIIFELAQTEFQDL